jgi:hypothetical protein
MATGVATAATAASSGVRIEELPTAPSGPLPPPIVINDKTRGRVHLLSKPRENFRALFEMKTGQLRGMAYHGVGTVIFDILEGSYVFMSANGKLDSRKLTGISIRQINAPARVDIPAGICHVFLPLSDGLIYETANASTEEFLNSYTKLPKEHEPYVEQIRKDIDKGKYKAHNKL